MRENNDYPREKPRIGAFIDFENLYFSLSNQGRELDIPALMAAISSAGKLVIARAYSVWVSEESDRLLEEYGIERIEPRGGTGSKNGVDNRMNVEIPTLCQDHELDGAIIVSGDGDFVELTLALQERGVWVGIIAVEGTISWDLRHESSAFILYGDLLKGGGSLREARLSINIGDSMQLQPQYEIDKVLTAIPETSFLVKELRSISISASLTIKDAEELHRRGMNMRRNSPGYAACCFLRAAKVLRSFNKLERRKELVEQVLYYLASYCSCKSLMASRLQGLNNAERYFLAYFSLIQQCVAARRRLTRLTPHMLSYYFALGAKRSRIYLPESPATMGAVPILSSIIRPKEHQHVQEGNRLFKRLEAVAPDLVREHLKEISFNDNLIEILPSRIHQGSLSLGY